MTDTDALPQALKDAVAAASFDGTVTIAYSGGLDSRFLAFAASKLGYRVVLLHVAGPHMAPSESEGAVKDARNMGLTVTVITANPLGITELAAAGKNRCYVCKRHVFTELLKHAAGGRLCDGTNASDLTVYRPGRKALTELGIHSPLAEACIGKPDIRRIARTLGMARPDQAARPCLLTRFPYGMMPDAGTLSLIAEAEDWLEAQPEARGLKFRLRFPNPQKRNEAVLHVEKSSLGPRTEADLNHLVQRLKTQFSPKLNFLTYAVLEKLSGFYDRT